MKRQPFKQTLVLLGFVISAAVAGIIGNRLDATLDSFLSREFVVSLFWIIFSTVVFSVIVAYLLYEVIRYHKALNEASILSRFGDSLATYVPSLYVECDPLAAEARAKRITKMLFEKVIRYHPFNQCSIAIYRPDASQKYLTVWETSSEYNESSDSLRFYVGLKSSPQARGIAGETFVDGKTRVVHFQRDGIADSNIYIPSSKGAPSYRSIICVAIVSDEATQESLGVLTLHSGSISTFDDKSTRTLIEALALRFSAVILSF